MTGGDSGNGEKWADSGENFEFGVPKGHLDGDVRLRGIPAVPRAPPPPFPPRFVGWRWQLELLKRAVFQKALSAG